MVSFISHISGRIALQNLSPVNAVTKMISPYADIHQSHCANVSFGYSVSAVRGPSFMSHHMAFNCPGYLSVQILTAILLELPISVVEGANLAGLEPAGDAVEMESMLAPHRQLIHYKECMVLLRCRFPMLQCIPH